MRHLIILIALCCAACSSGLPSFKPYKMDIQQGNVVNAKMMLQLRPDMTKSQVRFIMGTPLVQDSFHRDRWDYLYQMRKGGALIEQRHVILEFEGDALKRVRGHVIPVDADGNVVAAAIGKPETDRSFADKLKFWKSDAAADAVYVGQEAPAALVNPEYAPKPVPAPAPVVPAATKAAGEPATEPAPAPGSGVNVTPLPDNTPQAAPLSGDRPVAAPVAKPAAATAAPAAAQAPAPKTAVKQPEPAVDDDLPPEDAPGYFERMLEKIGF